MRAAALLASLLLLASCGAETREKPMDVPGQKLYTMRGTVVSRSSNDNTIRVAHEAIPGFMEAMTMDYSVRGAKVDALPADGERITARLHTTSDAYWLTDVKKSR